MKQTYVLQGLNCPNCAARIEADVQKLPDAGKVSLDLMRQTLVLEAEMDLMKQIETIVHTYEPDVKVHLRDGHTHSHDHSEGKGKLLRMGVGAAVFAAALLLGGRFRTLRLVLLIAASFFKNKPENTNGIICMILAALTIVLDLVRTRDTGHAVRALRNLDYSTLLLLTGMFLVIEGITQAGIVADLAGLIVRAGGGNLFRLYTLIVWGSVLISAFVDNIPYVATMLPVIASVAAGLGREPELLYFGLLIGATLGGNLTPVGASANIAAVGMLRQNKYQVSFGDFARIGVPFTLTAVMAGYLFIWFVWS